VLLCLLVVHVTLSEPPSTVVEVRLKPASTARFDTISELVKELLEQDETLYIPSILSGWETHRVLRQNVELITASESCQHLFPLHSHRRDLTRHLPHISFLACPCHVLPVGEAILEIHIYQPSQMDSSEDWIGGRLDGDDLSPATVCDLPNRSLEGVWDRCVEVFLCQSYHH
jgi:pachytene checkpoint protein 2